MTKSELIDLISERFTNLNKKHIEYIVNEMFLQIKKALINNDKVEIRGFGTFNIRETSEKIARNPKSGEQIKIPSKKVPYFKPGKEIKKTLIDL
jgi:integration host factor subunit beta